MEAPGKCKECGAVTLPDTPKYQADEDRLSRDFTYHRPSEDQTIRMVAIREKAGELARLAMESCPPDSRETSIAVRLAGEVSI